MIIETKNLTVGYKDNILYEDVNLTLESGSVTAMLGVNGAGKSTLLRTLCGFTPPLAGQIVIDGRDISTYSKAELSSLIAVVLTDRVGDGGLTVGEVVSMGRYPYTGFFGKLTKHDREVVTQALSDVGIEHMRLRYIAELSDGERQKVMIAKSLAQESKIIILDEPTSFLDLKSRMETIALLRGLARSKGSTFLLSLHEIELALQYADRLWILNPRKGIIQGQTENMVLSGAIDNAVGEGVSFDLSKGVFNPSSIGGNTLLLKGNELLWVANALRREGYSLSHEEGTAELNILSYEHLELDGEVFTSIESLIHRLRNR